MKGTGPLIFTATLRNSYKMVFLGTAQALVSGPEDAIRTFKSVLPWVSAPVSSSPSSPQYLFWSEQLLAKAALLASEAASEGPLANEQTAEFALKAFRLWSSHRSVKQGDPISTALSSAPASPGSRASIWQAYYAFLSSTLRRVVYVSPSESPKRVQLTTEFRRVETICENIVIKNTTFPKAEIKNREVEAWVEQFMQNWEVLCGPEWRDDDFGEGGQDAFSRNILDVSFYSKVVAVVMLIPSLLRCCIEQRPRRSILPSFCATFSMFTQP